jgi:hypothetical protein
MKRKLQQSDILSPQEFLEIRPQKHQEILGLKKNRRLSLGPDMMLYFENDQTLLWQIHEMLRIEKGGDEQIKDELSAYNPLIPQKQNDGSAELVATMMIEINDLERRVQTLRLLTHIEQMISLRFEDHLIKATPEDEEGRTAEDGKTSSIHFLRFLFSVEQIESFKQSNQDIILEVTHPHYIHKTLISENIRKALIIDFD